MNPRLDLLALTLFHIWFSSWDRGWSRWVKCGPLGQRFPKSHRTTAQGLYPGWTRAVLSTHSEHLSGSRDTLPVSGPHHLELFAPVQRHQFSRPVNGTVELSRHRRDGENTSGRRPAAGEGQQTAVPTGLFLLVCSSNSCRISRMASC